jgi:hypothetical protein
MRQPQRPLCNKQPWAATLEYFNELLNDCLPLTDSLAPNLKVGSDFNLTVSPEPRSPNDGYGYYLDLVQADSVGFYQILQTVFVVEGWDVRSSTITVCI